MQAPWQLVCACVHAGWAPHAPPVQTSAGPPSAPPQVVPFGAAGFEQVPVEGLHAPATWQASLAAQVTGFEPAQDPFWHESLCVQALPSLQVVPLEAAGFEQEPLVGSHVPATWHWSLAVQATGFEPVHAPATHA
jgi:hypothetical protein